MVEQDIVPCTLLFVSSLEAHEGLGSTGEVFRPGRMLASELECS
jgi:hypothetical protein